MREHFILLAEYNAWMNGKVYEAAGRLPAEALHAQRNAFFGSLFGTLMHLAVGDTMWLRRFTAHPAGFPALAAVASWPAPTALDQRLFASLEELRRYRSQLDDVIRQLVAQLKTPDLDYVLRYANSKGVVSHKRFSSLLLHFFNHQTHHRGQATTLLHQAGEDVGVTDLLALIPSESDG